jgi:hypothetical protein
MNFSLHYEGIVFIVVTELIYCEIWGSQSSNDSRRFEKRAFVWGVTPNNLVEA